MLIFLLIIAFTILLFYYLFIVVPKFSSKQNEKLESYTRKFPPLSEFNCELRENDSNVIDITGVECKVLLYQNMLIISPVEKEEFPPIQWSSKWKSKGLKLRNRGKFDSITIEKEGGSHTVIIKGKVLRIGPFLDFTPTNYLLSDTHLSDEQKQTILNLNDLILLNHPPLHH